MWSWSLLIMLTRCYTEYFRLKTQSDVFCHLGEVFAKNLKPDLGRLHPSVLCRCWRPTRSKWRNHSLISFEDGMQQDSSQHLLDAMCFCPLVWRFWFPADNCCKFCCVPAQRSSSLWWECWICTSTQCVTAVVPVFLNLLLITGGSRAAGAEWSWDLKQVKALLGAVREKEHHKVHRWEEQDTDRSSQILVLRKLSDHQELCKAETTMWEASSD